MVNIRCTFCCVPNIVFLGSIVNPRWPPRLLIGDNFDAFSETAERNLTKHHRKQYLNALVLPVLCFWVHPKTKLIALASDCSKQFRHLLWNHWMEFDESSQEARFQCPLLSLCFFGPIRKPRWLLLSQWLWVIRLLFCNHWTEFNETWTGSKISTSLPSFGPIIISMCSIPKRVTQLHDCGNLGHLFSKLMNIVFSKHITGNTSLMIGLS